MTALVRIMHWIMNSKCICTCQWGLCQKLPLLCRRIFISLHPVQIWKQLCIATHPSKGLFPCVFSKMTFNSALSRANACEAAWHGIIWYKVLCRMSFSCYFLKQKEEPVQCTIPAELENSTKEHSGFLFSKKNDESHSPLQYDFHLWNRGCVSFI